MKLSFTKKELHQLALQQLRQCGFKTNEIELAANGTQTLTGERLALVDGKQEYLCQRDWPMSVRIKASTPVGIITNRGMRTFLALPKDSQVIKGYGATVEEAETDCWEKFKKQPSKN